MHAARCIKIVRYFNMLMRKQFAKNVKTGDGFNMSTPDTRVVGVLQKTLSAFTTFYMKNGGVDKECPEIRQVWLKQFNFN